MTVLALLACAGNGRGPHPPPDPVPLDAFTADLEAGGWTVQEGLLHFSTYEHCCDPGANCLGNNPSTPYGTLAVPSAPGAPPDVDAVAAWGELPEDGMSRTWRMRADEAVVWIGTMPPPARYFSFRSYAMARPDAAGNLLPLLGSLGPSLNHLVVAADRGVDPAEVWAQPFVVVVTADAVTEEDIVGRLVRAGYAASSVHLDRIPPSVVNLGIEALDDLIGAVIRVAIDDDPLEGEAWRADPPATVLRLTPPAESAARPHPYPELLPQGSGLDEAAFADALLALDVAVLGWIGDRRFLPQGAPGGPVNTLECLPTATCNGDIRDRYVGVTPPFTLDDDELLVAYGVNHRRTGRATYANLAAVADDHDIGVAVLEDPEMVGTARYFLPDEPLVDDLYATLLARSCAGRPEPCVEVPAACPDSPTDEAHRVTVRAYLDPLTGVAPAPEELLVDRVVKVWPEPR